MTSYILFFPYLGLKEFLLKEIEIYYPTLKLSFSNQEFLSFKMTEGHEIKTLKKLNSRGIVFSRGFAEFSHKSKEDGSVDKRLKLEQKDGTIEYWHHRGIISTKFNRPIDIELPENAPARAYLKVAEFNQLSPVKIEKGHKIIEVGSAPGGISLYLLELGCHLISIDPAEMAPLLKETYPNNFTHLKKSIFDITQKNLPENCDWLISDLNLKGAVNIKQIQRLMRYYPQLKGAFLTVKTPKVEDMKLLSDAKLGWPEGFESEVFHLPSHRKEIGLIVYRIS